MQSTKQMTISEVMAGTDWELLSRQKLALIEASEQFPELEGVLNWIDEIQDAAEAEGLPVVFLSLEEPQDAE